MKHKKIYAKIVKLIAQCSPDSRLKVGALILKNNRIISTGYNGQLSGEAHKAIMINEHDISTVHAEQNAIVNCAKLGISTKDCILICTHFPCFECTKIIFMAGIKKVYYIEDYHNRSNPFQEVISIEQINKNG